VTDDYDDGPDDWPWFDDAGWLLIALSLALVALWEWLPCFPCWLP
jgi:hypothetical protein